MRRDAGGWAERRAQWHTRVEAVSSTPKGHAIKNKWKVHRDKSPVERKICRENTESHILFDWIKQIKQFVERGRGSYEVVGHPGGKRPDRTYPSWDLSSIEMEVLYCNLSISTGKISLFFLSPCLQNYREYRRNVFHFHLSQLLPHWRHRTGDGMGWRESKDIQKVQPAASCPLLPQQQEEIYSWGYITEAIKILHRNCGHFNGGDRFGISRSTFCSGEIWLMKHIRLKWTGSCHNLSKSKNIILYMIKVTLNVI